MARINIFLQLIIIAATGAVSQAQVLKIQKSIKWGNPQEIKISKYDKIKTLYYYLKGFKHSASL
jgi:hypothetical protein